MKQLTYILLIFFSVSAIAQTEEKLIIEVGTELPLNYSIGFASNITEELLFSFRAGIMTKPYDDLIIGFLGNIVTTEAETNTIRDAFTHGLMFKPGMNYRFSNFYTGVFYSYWRLFATDVPVDLLNNYFQLSLPPNFIDPIEYTLKSNLHNIGFVIGKTHTLKDNENIVLGTEFSIAKTVKTKNSLSNIYDNEMTLASGYVHDELNPLFLKYGYLPSFNFFIRFKL